MSALPLVLASAFTHALWNARLKRAADREAAAALLVGGAAILSGLLALILGEGAPPIEALPAVLGAGLVEAAYFLLLTAALNRLPLGTAYGVSRGAGLLLTWPLSIAFLGEQASTLDLVGAVLVSLGLFSTTQGAGPGLGYALGCAVAIGLYPLTYKSALHAGAPPKTLFALSLAIAWPVQAAFLGPRRWQRLRGALTGDPLGVGLSALLCAASFLLFLGALAQAGAGWSTALRNCSVLVALLLGVGQGERPGLRGLIGALGIAAGAVLLAL
jgi:uncharacterized membrane protein